MTSPPHSVVIALLACHNRRDQTVACLEALFQQEAAGLVIEAIVVDDGSTDGSADACRAVSEKVEVLPGDGTLYWARAMAIAERRAVGRRPDYLLWLNDDMSLRKYGLAMLMAARDLPTDGRIVVGSTIDAETGVATYGGANRDGRHPLRYTLIAPSRGEPRAVTTFNGNAVLVPKAIYRQLGGIDGAFTHALADLDYGLRARSAGFEVVVTGSPVGTCSSHSPGGSWNDSAVAPRDRLKLALGRKGVPPRSTARFLRRHGGRNWAFFWAATYVKLLGSILIQVTKRRAFRQPVD